jgi:hypothetical protein
MSKYPGTCDVDLPALAKAWHETHRKVTDLLPGDLTDNAGGRCTCPVPDASYIVITAEPLPAVPGADQGGVEVTWMHSSCGQVFRPLPCGPQLEVAYLGHDDDVPDPAPGIARACAYDELLNQSVDVGNAEAIAGNIAERVTAVLTAYQDRRSTPLLTIIRTCAEAELGTWLTSQYGRVASAADRAGTVALHIADRADTWIGRPAAVPGQGDTHARRVLVKVVESYGAGRVYPEDDTARLFTALTGRKTFTPLDLDTIRKLGYEITLRMASPRLPDGYGHADII